MLIRLSQRAFSSRTFRPPCTFPSSTFYLPRGSRSDGKKYLCNLCCEEQSTNLVYQILIRNFVGTGYKKIHTKHQLHLLDIRKRRKTTISIIVLDFYIFQWIRCQNVPLVTAYVKIASRSRFERKSGKVESMLHWEALHRTRHIRRQKPQSRRRRSAGWNIEKRDPSFSKTRLYFGRAPCGRGHSG